jgi:putative SOS response-associated peptidase YedK
MCGRITQKSNPHVLGLKIVTLIEPLPEAGAAAPRFNGAPGQQHWVIRQHPETGARHLDRLWWGLIPYWTKEPSPKLKPINATAERVAAAPMFRSAYAKRRCLVPVDNFEWMKAGKGPSSLTHRHEVGRPFALAGIWEAGIRDGEIFRSLRHHHDRERAAHTFDRMPVILTRSRSLARCWSPTCAICCAHPAGP